MVMVMAMAMAMATMKKTSIKMQYSETLNVKSDKK